MTDSRYKIRSYEDNLRNTLLFGVKEVGAKLVIPDLIFKANNILQQIKDEDEWDDIVSELRLCLFALKLACPEAFEYEPSGTRDLGDAGTLYFHRN